MAKPNKWDSVHDELEKKGKFDTYTTPILQHSVLPVDENYVYLPKNILFRAYGAFLKFVCWLFAPIVNKIGFGVKIKGRENLKALKNTGAFSVSNHVHFMDNLMIRQAVNPRKDIYFTVAPHNCKKGFGGMTMRAGGILPFSGNAVAKTNMAAAMHELMLKKKLVHVYAEKALWYRYEKPRPHKTGAYYFAYAEKVPVLPIFVCWRENKGLRKLLKLRKAATVLILEPMYFDEKLDRFDAIVDLKNRVQQRYIDVYRQFYKVEGDIYLTD
ncbi:MAG: lysophospholipid acyltransferase family protein [Clostridia bacterium]